MYTLMIPYKVLTSIHRREVGFLTAVKMAYYTCASNSHCLNMWLFSKWGDKSTIRIVSTKVQSQIQSTVILHHGTVDLVALKP